MLYGFPGSGKTYFARQLTDTLQIAHLQADRLRHELFEKPRFDAQENNLVNHLMDYMAEEFLKAGVSVIYDTNAMRQAQRRHLRELGRSVKASHLLVWIQIDQDSSFSRTQGRDRRKTDDKYALGFDSRSFEEYLSQMQNPKNEEYVVISGKHNFSTQRSAVIKRLYEKNLVDAQSAVNRTVKPGLINLVPAPNAGRVDISRRNIVIR